MAYDITDLAAYKSLAVTNLPGNGGVMSRNAVPSAKHGMFERVTASERSAGVTRFRKVFLTSIHAANEVAAGVQSQIESPSRANDHFLLAKGTQRDIQSAAAGYDYVGCGQLNTALSGGETQVALLMESADAVFLNGGLVHLSSKYMAGQTAGAGVRPGNSVQDTAGTWELISDTEDIAYPKGRWLGDGLVYTDNADSEEWRRLVDNLVEDEAIGTGDGASTSPALSDLASIVNGVCGQAGKLAVVTATCGGVSRSVTIQPDGSCTGYCAAGQLNMADGTWTTPIQWTTAPDNGASITITYRDLCYSYSGSVCTVDLAEQVANAYATAETYGGGVIEGGDLEALVDTFTDADTASGTFDEAGQPISTTALGAEEEDWTLTFSSATAFTVAGARIGSVGVGSVSEDFAPLNPATGAPYFTIPSAAWGGTWANGETVAFTTHPAALPLWFQEVVPAGTAEESYNLLNWGYWVD